MRASIALAMNGDHYTLLRLGRVFFRMNCIGIRRHLQVGVHCPALGGRLRGGWHAILSARESVGLYLPRVPQAFVGRHRPGLCGRGRRADRARSRRSKHTATALDEKAVKARSGRLLAEAKVAEDGSFEL